MTGWWFARHGGGGAGAGWRDMRSLRCVMLGLVLCAAACTGQADDLPDFNWDVQVTSEVPLDRVEVFHTGPDGSLAAVGPITPPRRARGDLAPEPAIVRGAGVVDRDL